MTRVEMPVTLRFFDVRASTAMGKGMRPTAFHDFLHHFDRLASDAIVAHDGIVDNSSGMR